MGEERLTKAPPLTHQYREEARHHSYHHHHHEGCWSEEPHWTGPRPGSRLLLGTRQARPEAHVWHQQNPEGDPGDERAHCCELSEQPSRVQDRRGPCAEGSGDRLDARFFHYRTFHQARASEKRRGERP